MSSHDPGPDFQSYFENILRATDESIQKRMLLLGGLALATSLNDQQFLAAWLPECSPGLEQVTIEEVVLQNLLFAGFPKTIEALKTVRNHFPNVAENSNIQNRRDHGIKTSQEVYGNYHARLLEVMDGLHPELTRWMIEDGYGRILSRPGLTLADREVAVLASLMATGMTNQFKAHFRGALNAGVKQVDIIWFTNIFQCIIAADLRPAFEGIQTQLLESRDLKGMP